MTSTAKLDESALLFDETTATEIDGANLLLGDTPPEPWVPGPGDEAEADRYLRGFRYYTELLAAQTANADAQADAEIARIEAWRDAQTRDARNAIAYCTHMLRSFSDAVGRVKRTSPAGTIKWRKGSKYIVVDDPATFCVAHAGTPLVRIKPAPDPEPDKTAIRDHIKSTGDIPDGADEVRGDDTFVIDTP